MSNNDDLEWILQGIRDQRAVGGSVTPYELFLIGEGPRPTTDLPDPPAQSKGVPVVVAKKTVTRKAATRHRPASRKAARPTKLQRQGAEMISRAEREERGAEHRRSAVAKQRKKSLAYRASHKIKAKHKVLRPVTYLAVGASVLVAKGAKSVAIGSGKATVWGSRRLVARVRADVRRRKWTPVVERPEGERWYQRSMGLKCVCGKRYSSVQRLNRHLVEDHRGEAKTFERPRPKIQRGHTRRTAGKTIVRPKVAGGGRHRARHSLPDARRVQDILAAYQTQLNKIKEAAMALSSFQRASDDLAELRPPRKDGGTRRSDFYQQLREIEESFAVLGDGVSSYCRTLRSEKGYNIDPAIVNPFERSSKEAIDLVAESFTRFIATFEDVYRVQIQAAGGGFSPPKLNLGA